MSNLAPGIAHILRNRTDKWEVLRLWLEKLDGEKLLIWHYHQRAKEALSKGRAITKKEIDVKRQKTITKLLRSAEVIKLGNRLTVPRSTKLFIRRLGASTTKVSLASPASGLTTNFTITITMAITLHTTTCHANKPATITRSSNTLLVGVCHDYQFLGS